ncbi:MAG: hypothetical protein GX601_10270 [Anaerolineales bacterium]|nr:hypothetical protein [Anaerolineales bacterium]
MVALVCIGIFVLVLAIRPREQAWASTPARESSGSGGGGGALLLIAAIGIIAVLVLASGAVASLDSATSSIAVGGVEVQERADNHVLEKHGTSARETLQRSGQREYHYSASRETVMVSACDGTNCACMFVGVRGRDVTGVSGPQAIAGGLELSCYYMPVLRRATVIMRDGYSYMGRW